MIKEFEPFKRKVAHNRGNCRIWIEGKKLLEANINNGDRFDCTIFPTHVVLEFHPDGERKVAGKPERPIIDINTARLNPLFDSVSHYMVSHAGYMDLDNPIHVVIKPHNERA